MRLDKFVAEALPCTRSEARALIRAGRVTVAGQPCRKPDEKLAEGVPVLADGRALTRTEFVYLMLNKPAGVVSASRGAPGEQTVADLVRADFPRRELFPAGRLDKSSTGFVLLTDDGGFAHDILSPRHHVPKTYRVELDTPLTQEMVAGFAAGPTLADGERLQGAQVRALSADGCTVEVVLRQGIYHQIKRMFGLYGAGVNALHRTAIGGLSLDEALAPGQWRALSAEEVAAIAGEVRAGAAEGKAEEKAAQP